MKAIKELVEKEKIDCDFVVTRATDVCLYEDIRKELKSGLEALTAAKISSAAEVHYSDGRTAEGVRANPSISNCRSVDTSDRYPGSRALKAVSPTQQATCGLTN